MNIQRKGAMKPNNSILNERGTIYLIAYRVKNNKKFAQGVAQVIDRIGMWEYSWTPFKYCDPGMIPVQWLFCKDFEIPALPLFGHEGKNTVLDLDHADLIPQNIGTKLFNLFKRGKSIDPMRTKLGDKLYEKM